MPAVDSRRSCPNDSHSAKHRSGWVLAHSHLELATETLVDTAIKELHVSGRAGAASLQAANVIDVLATWYTVRLPAAPQVRR